MRPSAFMAWTALHGDLAHSHPDEAVRQGLRRVDKERLLILYGRPGVPRNAFELVIQGVRHVIMLHFGRYSSTERRVEILLHALFAALDRPELWVCWISYGLWLAWRDPGARRLVSRARAGAVSGLRRRSRRARPR